VCLYIYIYMPWPFSSEFRLAIHSGLINSIVSSARILGQGSKRLNVNGEEWTKIWDIRCFQNLWSNVRASNYLTFDFLVLNQKQSPKAEIYLNLWVTLPRKTWTDRLRNVARSEVLSKILTAINTCHFRMELRVDLGGGSGILINRSGIMFRRETMFRREPFIGCDWFFLLNLWLLIFPFIQQRV